MTPEYRLSLFYNPSDPFWHLVVISILSGMLFSIAVFGTWQLLKRLRRPRLGGGH